MKVNLSFAQHIDVIEFDPFIGENIDEYMEAFSEWYYDKKDNGFGINFIPKDRFIKRPLDAELIIEWLNEACPTCNVHIILQNISLGQEDKNLPYMCF